MKPQQSRVFDDARDVTKTETCDRCGATIDDDATANGWPVCTLDHEYVGPCCIEDGYCASCGGVLPANVETSTCETCPDE